MSGPYFWRVYGEISVTSVWTDSCTFLWGASLGTAFSIDLWLLIGYTGLFDAVFMQVYMQVTYLGYIFSPVPPGPLLSLPFPLPLALLMFCPTTQFTIYVRVISSHRILCVFWQLGPTNDKKHGMHVFLRLIWFLNINSSSRSLLSAVCARVCVCCVVFSCV